MDLQHDIEKLLANGFFKTSRRKSPVRSSNTNPSYQKFRSVPSKNVRQSRICPPRPIVEDEIVSISREVSPPLICYDPPHRGTIDQNPIIQYAEIDKVEVPTAKKVNRGKSVSANQPPSISVHDIPSSHHKEPISHSRDRSPRTAQSKSFHPASPHSETIQSESNYPEPSFSEPAYLEPAQSELAYSGHHDSGPAYSEPPYSELLHSHPPHSEYAHSQPPHSQYAHSQPPHSEYAHSEPPHSEYDHSEPPYSEYAHSELSRSELPYYSPSHLEPPHLEYHQNPHKKSRKSILVKPKKITPPRKIRSEHRRSPKRHATPPKAISIPRNSSFEYLPAYDFSWESPDPHLHDNSDSKKRERKKSVPAPPVMGKPVQRSYSTSSPDTPDSDYGIDRSHLEPYANYLNETLSKHTQRSEDTRIGRREKCVHLSDDARSRSRRHTSTHSVRFAHDLETDFEASASPAKKLIKPSRSSRRLKKVQRSRGDSHPYLETPASRPSRQNIRTEDYPSSDDEKELKQTDSDEYLYDRYHHDYDDNNSNKDQDMESDRAVRRKKSFSRNRSKEVRHRSFSRTNRSPADNRRLVRISSRSLSPLRARMRSRSCSPSTTSSQLALVHHFEQPDAFQRPHAALNPTSLQSSPFTSSRDFYRPVRHLPTAPPPFQPLIPSLTTAPPQLYSQQLNFNPPPTIYQNNSLYAVDRPSGNMGHELIKPLRPCPRTNFMPDKDDWLTLPDCPNFDICPSCFEASMAPTEFGQFFVASPRITETTETLCDFGTSPWYRIAWLMIITEKLRSLDLFYELAEIAVNNPPCQIEHDNSIKWCSVIDPWIGVPIPGFEVCLSCVKSVEALLPALKGIFVFVEPYNTHSRVCSLRSRSKRFVPYFDRLELIAAKSKYEETSPDARPFVRLVQFFSQFEECQQDNEILEHRWHIINQLPEFTVCEECFNDIVLPLINQGSSVASMFDEETRRVPRASCQLYSSRMRELFRIAVAADNFNLLASKARERKTIELRIIAQTADLRQRIGTWGVTEELAKLQKEWRTWE